MILKVYSAIMPEEDRMCMQWMGLDGVSFNSIDEFIASIPDDDDTIDMRINSPGGVVPEGWAIIDKLRATGKKIIATIEGDAASMAAIVLLAASERKAYKHARLLIHDAYFPEYTLAGAYRKEDLEKLAASLDEDNKRALDFMVERTGADRDTLEALMKEDKFIDMEQAKELGFIHEILEPASASVKPKAWKRTQTNSSTDMSNTNKIASAFKAFAEALGISVKMEDDPAPVGYVLTAQDGTEITIDKPEGEDPAVGDAASPDGEFLMPDGTTFVVADGVITEIRDAEPADDEPADDEPATDEAHEAEIAAKDAEIAALQARITELEANQMSDDQKTILAKVEKAGGKAWLDKATKSNYKPEQRQRQVQTVEPKTSQIASDLEAARARRKAKRQTNE